MIGLSAQGRRSTELLVGRDVDLVIGLRVTIASRYSHDVWARDETGGREGTIVDVLETAPGSHSLLVSGKGAGPQQQGVVVVRWDRADGREWSQPKSSVEGQYTGTYRCGSRGAYHLSLAASQPLQGDGKPHLVTSKREGHAQTGDAPVHPGAWDWLYEAAEDDEALAEVAARAKELEAELMELEPKVLSQMEALADMCEGQLEAAADVVENNIDAAGNLLPGGALRGAERPESGADADGVPAGPDERGQLDPLRAALQRQPQNARFAESFPAVKEEAKLDEEMGHMWGAIEAAEGKYRAKVAADQAFAGALQELQQLARPAHLVFCSAAVPEVERTLERIVRSGFANPLAHGGWSNVRELLVPRPAGGSPDDAAAAEAKLGEVRSGLEELARQLSAWKFRHPLLDPPAEDEGPAWQRRSLTPAEEAALPEDERARWQLLRPLSREERAGLSADEHAAREAAEAEERAAREAARAERDAVRRERDARTNPQLLQLMMDEDGAKVDEWIAELERLAGEPEAELVKPEMEKISAAFKAGKEAAKKLKEWEDKAGEPDSVSPEGRKKRLEEHEEILKEVAAALAGGDKEEKKDDKKDDKKKEDKKKDDKKEGEGEGAGKLGPLYDPEDFMGGAEAGGRLEGAVRTAREAFMSMRLRQDEVRHRRELDARERAARARAQAKGAGGAGMGADGTQTEALAGMYFDGDVLVRRAGTGSAGQEVWEEAQAEGLAAARGALCNARRLLARVDAAAWQNRGALQGGGWAVGPGMPALVQRASELRARLEALDTRLAGAEDSLLARARAIVAGAERRMRGQVRGEYLFDAGEGHAWLASAQRALERCCEAQRVRAEDVLARDQAHARHAAGGAREQAGRLLVEATALAAAAEAKLPPGQNWPVDALVLLAAARDKWLRAQVAA